MCVNFRFLGKLSVFREVTFLEMSEFLKDQLEKNVKTDDKLSNLYQSLKDINAKLWVIEDDKRECEKNKDFGENLMLVLNKKPLFFAPSIFSSF